MTPTETTYPSYTDQLSLCRYTSGVEYSIFKLEDQYHWEGHETEARDYSAVCSADGFDDINDCIADVLYSFYRLDGSDDETAALNLYELGLPAVPAATRTYDFDADLPDLEV